MILRGLVVVVVLGYSPVADALRAAEVASARGGNGLDVLLMRDGRAVAGRIIYLTDEKVRMKVILRGRRGQGSALRDVPVAGIRAIDFAPLPGEVETLADPMALELSDLRRLWNERQRHLARPGSHAGAIGLAYGNRLLDGGNRVQKDDALKVFGEVEKSDWDENRRSSALVGRLRAWMAVGRADEAVVEAEAIENSTEDPGILIEAKYVLASGKFDALKTLIDAHPLWREDDDVRPECDRLFNRAVDSFLFPFLFFGSREHEAARGLWMAGEVFRLVGQSGRARDCAGDVLALYPDSDRADQARAFLESTAPPEENKREQTGENDHEPE